MLVYLSKCFFWQESQPKSTTTGVFLAGATANIPAQFEILRKGFETARENFRIFADATHLQTLEIFISEI